MNIAIPKWAQGFLNRSAKKSREPEPPAATEAAAAVAEAKQKEVGMLLDGDMDDT